MDSSRLLTLSQGSGYSFSPLDVKSSPVSSSSGRYQSLSGLSNYGASRNGNLGNSANAMHVNMNNYMQTSSSTPANKSAEDVGGVIATFRHLQEKARKLGVARAKAYADVNTLRNELSETRRTASLSRSRAEIEATDLLLIEKSNRENMAMQHSDVRTKVAHAVEESLILQRQESEMNIKLSNLEDEIANIQSKNRDRLQMIEDRKNSTRLAEKRCDVLQEKLTLHKSRQELKRARTHKELSILQQRIVRVSKSSMRTAMRCTALEKYMSIILQINGDLCSTIAATEQSRARIARISARYMPPRYAWPKMTSGDLDTNFNDIEKGSPPRSPSPRRGGAVPMSPAEFAKQMMSANTTLDQEALQTAIRSMAAIPPPANVAGMAAQRAVEKFTKKKGSRSLSPHRPVRPSNQPIPDTPTVSFSERLKRGTLSGHSLAQASAATHISPDRLISNSKSPDKPAWQPSGVAPGRSMNVVAQVSRASRAAGYLNATIASKVKSLSEKSAKEYKLFSGDTTNYVTIRDLYGKLSVVKRAEARGAMR